MGDAIKVISDTGIGRAFVLISEALELTEYISLIGEHLAGGARVIQIQTPRITNHNWKEHSTAVIDLSRELSLKQACFVGFGAACALIQNAYLREPKMVRTLVLVNGSCRPHPSRFERWIDAIEQYLPLGLPLRSSSQGFDSRSHLQRIRCPSLVVTLPDAGEFLMKQAHLINQAMPTSWYQHVDDAADIKSLATFIREFQEVPAKCPQKNLRAA